MLQTIVDRLGMFIAGSSTPAASVDRIGQIEPSSTVQLPRLVISVSVDDTRGTGFGRFTRAGDVVTEQSVILQVAAGANGFAADLRSARVEHLPLKKNPASLPGPFGPSDISIENVSTATAIPYQLIATPSTAEQFSLDENSATLRFGAAQVPGNKLHLVHWTVQWRDDIVTTRLRGRLFIDVWASEASQLDGVARKLTQSLFGGADGLRANGFAQLSLTNLDAITSVMQQPGHATSFAAWRQRLVCTFVFDHETGGAVSEGIPIERIEVHPARFVREDMTVR